MKMNCKFCINKKLIRDRDNFFVCSNCKSYFSNYDHNDFLGINLDNSGLSYVNFYDGEIFIVINGISTTYEYDIKHLSDIKKRDFLIKFYDNLEFV